MQPSAQGIASMFMGNPGALAARVDQDRKSSPMGIPDDLRQLMALNIVTTENDAAKRQQAMSQLQQMAPNGKPPTVAENVRQQAAQKLQARMVQEQQKQQAMQQMLAGLPAAGVPANVPQPQGIDQAPVEFGMAGGGIVSFDGTKGSTVPEPTEDIFTQLDREKAEKLIELRQQLEQVNPMLTAAARSGDPEAIQQYARQAQNIRNQIESIRESAGNRMAGIEALVNPPAPAPSRAAAPEMPAGRFNRMPGAEQLELPTTRATPALPASVNRGMLNQADAATFAARPERAAPAPAPAPKRKVDAGLPSALPVVKAAAQPPAAPKQEVVEDKRLSPQGLLNMGSAAQLQDEAEFEKRVGAPSTEALDRLMAEYERQKAEAASPTGMAGLVEFMSQIAAGARPGRSSLQAAAAGVTGTQALDRERAARRTSLTEKQIEIEQKKLDMARDYAKEKYGVGKAAFDRAYKNNFEIYKDQGLDYRQAELFAQQKTLKDIDFGHQKELEGIRARNQAAQRPLDVMGEAWRLTREGKTEEAQKLMRLASEFAGAKKPGLDMELLKKFESLPGVKSELETLNTLRSIRDPKPAVVKQISDIEARLASKALANKIDPVQIGLGSTSTGGGGQRTIDWNAIK